MRKERGGVKGKEDYGGGGDVHWKWTWHLQTLLGEREGNEKEVKKEEDFNFERYLSACMACMYFNDPNLNFLRKMSVT